MSQVAVTVTLPIGHPNLDQILALASAPEHPSSGTDTDRKSVLDRLLAADLNTNEVAFLKALAVAAPELVSYEALLELAGSPQKLGNITSGLYRRWKSRGGVDSEAPWTDVANQGRRMATEDAAVVLAHLAGTDVGQS